MTTAEPVDHTLEDCLTWADVLTRIAPKGGATLWTRSLMQDRRDGELMLYFVAHRERAGGVYENDFWIDFSGNRDS